MDSDQTDAARMDKDDQIVALLTEMRDSLREDVALRRRVADQQSVAMKNARLVLIVAGILSAALIAVLVWVLARWAR